MNELLAGAELVMPKAKLPCAGAYEWWNELEGDEAEQEPIEPYINHDPAELVRILVQPSHGAFPAIVHLPYDELPEHYRAHIVGDVYNVYDTELAERLDSYEGYPHMYRKGMASYSGIIVTYYYMALTKEDIHDTEVIVSQDWQDRDETATLNDYLELFSSVEEAAVPRVARAFRYDPIRHAINFGN